MSRNRTPCCDSKPYDLGRDRIDIYTCRGATCNQDDWCDVCGPAGTLTNDGMRCPPCPTCGQLSGWSSTAK